MRLGEKKEGWLWNQRLNFESRLSRSGDREAIPSGRLSGRQWLPGSGVSSHPTDGSALLAAVAAALIDGGFFAEKVAAPSSGPSPPAPHTSTRLQRGLLSFSPLPYSPLASGSDPEVLSLNQGLPSSVHGAPEDAAYHDCLMAGYTSEEARILINNLDQLT